MTMNTTYHAGVERANRLQALEETLGFTKIVLQFEDVVEEKLYLLTSSGIIIVKSTRRDAVITAYMANINQCHRLYRLAGKSQMSPKMEKRVKKNCERHPELFAVVGQKPYAAN